MASVALTRRSFTAALLGPLVLVAPAAAAFATLGEMLDQARALSADELAWRSKDIESGGDRIPAQCVFSDRFTLSGPLECPDGVACRPSSYVIYWRHCMA